MDVPDDPEKVPDSSYVLRRVHPNLYVPDGNGGRRASSAAFREHGGAMSVGLTAVLDEMGLPPERAVEDYDGFGLLRFPVEWVRREQRLGVVRSPTEAEPWHGDVHGVRSQSVRKQFVNNANDWVRTPDVSHGDSSN